MTIVSSCVVDQAGCVYERWLSSGGTLNTSSEAEPASDLRLWLRGWDSNPQPTD
jgi:hypothetical protein